MTYTTYKTTTQNPPAGISEPAWKDPVSGHDYKNDPERDNHLFDSHKAYHAKDDGQRINQILKQLKELGGDYGFNTDFKNNPKGKMRCTHHSQRTQKSGKAFSTKHNDRNFESNPDHIVKDRTVNNITWNWCGDEFTFDEGEKKFYEENFEEQLIATNKSYIKNRHKERCKTMDQWRKSKQHCPEDTIIQIGCINNHPDVRKSMECFEEYIKWLDNWNEKHGQPMKILNWALHQDEQGAPHFHIRRVWMYRDEDTDLLTTGQEAALKIAGVELPNPDQKEDRWNNRKKTFDKMCREKWIQISRQHGLEIEDTPKPKEQTGLTLEEFQKLKDEKRNKIYQELVELANENMAALEKISEWEFLGPKVERFEKWLENEFFYYDTGNAEEKRLIKKQIVSAFANSTKAIQDKFTEQIAEYQKLLEDKKPELQIKRKDMDWER